MTAAIQTRGLGKTYGPVRAVADLDLVVESGQVFAFLGPNGAGKPVTELRRSLPPRRGRWVSQLAGVLAGDLPRGDVDPVEEV